MSKTFFFFYIYLRDRVGSVGFPILHSVQESLTCITDQTSTRISIYTPMSVKNEVI